MKNTFFFSFSQIVSKKVEQNYNEHGNRTNILFSLCISLIISLFMVNFEIENIKEIESVRKHLAKNCRYETWPFLFDINLIMKLLFRCERENISQGRSYENSFVNISSCFFLRFSEFSGDGGVVYVSINYFSMYINSSMFYNCICSGHGGAIFYISSDSYFGMICANRCSSFSNHHFVVLSASHGNQIEYLSVCYCSKSPSGFYPIWLESGYQIFNNNNCSLNNAQRGSVIGIDSPSMFSSLYCTFSNNIASEERCIYIFSESGSISFLSSNFVHNNSPSRNGVIFVQGDGYKKMMNCIFHNNHNYLFCIWQGSLEVSNCFIDHSLYSLSTLTIVSTETNNSFSFIMTFQIPFFNSFHCYADLPLIVYSLTRSINETIARTYDSKCEINGLSTDRIIGKNKIEMFPIFISLMFCN